MSTDASQKQPSGSVDPPENCLGSKAATIVLYTAHRPVLCSALNSEGLLSVPGLISLNGNHWRKILTIFAKLASVDVGWRVYRDHCLLHKREAICFSTGLLESASLHLIAGKASREYLGMDLKEFQALDMEQRLWVKGNVMCTPYFDYRQFPNALVEIARARIFAQLNGDIF